MINYFKKTFNKYLMKIYCNLMDIQTKQYEKLQYISIYYDEINTIQKINLMKNNIIKDIIYDFLYGNHIILKFDENIEIYLFEEMNYHCSNILTNKFKLKKKKFKISLKYNKKIMNIIMNFLIYYQNEYFRMKYNKNGNIFFIFEDNYYNFLFLQLNYNELTELISYLEFFQIESLLKHLKSLQENITISFFINKKSFDVNNPLSYYI
jgi:hypothetical protein